MNLKTKIILIKKKLMTITKKLMIFKEGLILSTKDHTDTSPKLWRS